jgi:D-arabinose 1-dehydrogenase-like Zn-dependent alcohol dehydrogenase
MKAARIVKLNEPLQVRELQTPTPTREETQVLIKVLSVIGRGVINP